MLMVRLLECKCFATSVTTIRCLTSVKAFMLLEEIFRCKQFGTHITFPLLAFMCLRVLLQVLLLECNYISDNLKLLSYSHKLKTSLGL